MMHQNSDMICVQDFENYARKTLSRSTLGYYTGGADDEVTLRDNREAFSRYKIRGRYMRGITTPRISTTILGCHPISMPVCIAPSSLNKMAHDDGEIGVAKAAHTLHTASTLSTFSSCSLEDVASAAPDGLRLFQLYVFKDRSTSRRLIQRAERAGYKAVVLTVDAPVMGKRRADHYNHFSMPAHLDYANFRDTQYSGRDKDTTGGIVTHLAASFVDPGITWQDVTWLKSITKLPVIVKGLLTGEDAREAVACGVSAVWVSNHGGRQLDSAPATIDVLPEVVSAVAGKCEVYIDGGVRTGTDVIKAVGLGADVVFVGRPVLYGLAYDGENGVRQLLQILKDEIEKAMILSGCADLQDLRKENVIVHQSYYHKTTAPKSSL